MKMSVKTFCVVTSIFLGAQAIVGHAGGIPVIDVSNLAQQIQQVVSWGKQLEAMKQQYDQQQAQYQSMTGNRGYGNALNDPKLRQYLPGDWKTVYDSIKTPQTPSFDCRQLSPSLLDSCNAVTNKHYLERDRYTQAYDIATLEQAQIQGLINQISVTDDPKAIAELQARIAGEQAKIQNTLVQLQLSNQLAEIQNKLLAQQAQEAYLKKRFDGRNDGYDVPEKIKW